MGTLVFQNQKTHVQLDTPQLLPPRSAPAARRCAITGNCEDQEVFHSHIQMIKADAELFTQVVTSSFLTLTDTTICHVSCKYIRIWCLSSHPLSRAASTSCTTAVERNLTQTSLEVAAPCTFRLTTMPSTNSDVPGSNRECNSRAYFWLPAEGTRHVEMNVASKIVQDVGSPNRSN